MENQTIIFALIASAVGYGASTYLTKKKLGSVATEAAKKLAVADKTALKIETEARENARKVLDASREDEQKAREDEQKRRRDIVDIEERLIGREKNLDSKLTELDNKSSDLDDKSARIKQAESELETIKAELLGMRDKQIEKLEKIAKLTKKEAEEKLIQTAEKDIKEDLNGLLSKLKKDAMDMAEDNAQMIITSAMERVASDTVSERTVTAVKLQDEEMKGRIIGKEGRNIQSLQRATGVDIMVDDTPGMIILSSFDPIRREVARQALEMLLKDGRVHPARIEEVVDKAQKLVEKDVIRAGEEAAREVGVIGMPPEILDLLGQLKYRTSYGQNVLGHSVEMAHMAGIIAEQIGANVKVTKYAALVHDLGKALTHKMEGKHHHISGEMLRKYGVSEDIAHAAEAHHDDLEATTPEALIVRTVDAISAARPGARNVSAENFGERMRELENVTNGFKGVEKSYAISAGREIRVFVKPGQLDDYGAAKLAKDIAHKIESTMQYPGTIKVNVIRETRAEEYAK
jgi:ribonucrease Y